MIGMWWVGGSGLAAVIFASIVAFFPPSLLPIGSPVTYTALVAAGTVIFFTIPFIISMVMARKKRKQSV